MKILKHQSSKFSTLVLVLIQFLIVCSSLGQNGDFRVNVTLKEGLTNEKLTGRLFILINDVPQPTPREVAFMTFAAAAENPKWGSYAPLFGMDVNEWQSGVTTSMTNTGVQGYPFHAFSDVPKGDYYVQAVLNVYTEYKRSDGHILWAPDDNWEGQQFHQSPGNIYSDVTMVHFDPADGFNIELTLSEIIPSIPDLTDTRFIKYVKIKSEKVSEFWGQDMHVGAIVRLPKGYYDHPEKSYPVLYYQGHFQEKDRFVIPEERPEAKDESIGNQAMAMTRMYGMMYDAWAAEDAPQMIVVTWQHPTPFYDDAYVINTPNTGPWADAVFDELIPELNKRFRIIDEPWARVMTGGSTGGWIAAALQIYYPEYFGGTWSFCPDPISFEHFGLLNVYEDENAFIVPGQKWVNTEMMTSRSVEGMPMNTSRRVSQLSLALGGNSRSGEYVDNWFAMYGPVGEDGYPKPLYNHTTGKVDQSVSQYWKESKWDLTRYVEAKWDQIGQELEGKLHFICGEMDQFYLNLAMYDMQAVLEGVDDPKYGGYFRYERPKVGHEFAGYDQLTLKDLMHEMLIHIAGNTPEGTEMSHWNIPSRD